MSSVCGSSNWFIHNNDWQPQHLRTISTHQRPKTEKCHTNTPKTDHVHSALGTQSSPKKSNWKRHFKFQIGSPVSDESRTLSTKVTIEVKSAFFRFSVASRSARSNLAPQLRSHTAFVLRNVHGRPYKAEPEARFRKNRKSDKKVDERRTNASAAMEKNWRGKNRMNLVERDSAALNPLIFLIKAYDI